MKSIQDIINHYTKEDKHMKATFNQVSDCCHMDIINGRRAEHPLGEVYEVEYCEACGKDCSPADQCEICGDLRCQGECEKRVLFCTVCLGFTTDYTNRGECSDCGSEVIDDISEGEE